jgi:hypothetical protein
MKDDDKLRVVAGYFSKDDKARAERAKAFRNIREGWAEHLEFTEILAQMTRAKYLALVKEGFTEAQAIELCKGG